MSGMRGKVLRILYPEFQYLYFKITGQIVFGIQIETKRIKVLKKESRLK